MAQDSFVLAMYDVCGKQNFIYRTRKCKEIVGGSRLIAGIYEKYLYSIQIEGGKIYNCPKTESSDQKSEKRIEEFSVEAFKDRMDSGEFIGEVVYEGGGNFFVLYKNEEICKEIHKKFSRSILKEIGTLRVTCTYITDLNFEDYRADEKRLKAKHRITEAQEMVLFPVNTLPFTDVSPETGRPYLKDEKDEDDKKKLGKEDEKLTREQRVKYKYYGTYLKSLEGTPDWKREAFLLDELVTEHGKESLLAVIYIDGNNMREKVEKCLEGKKTYNECVNELRRFSEEIDQKYVKDRKQEIDEALEKKYQAKKERVRRTIVSAGDEMTIICNARDALDVVKTYFEGLPETENACAGIAIFHSHAPYSDVYRIAEQCCEHAKKTLRKSWEAKGNLLDFHYCQGGIGISLKSIRRSENLESLLSKPWRIEKSKKILLTPTFAETGSNLIHLMKDELNKLGHSNVQCLCQAAQSGSTELDMELKRIIAHSEQKPDFSLGGKLKAEEQRRLIYDMVIVYDLWFWEAKK